MQSPPPYFENWVGGSTPQKREGRGNGGGDAHYDGVYKEHVGLLQAFTNCMHGCDGAHNVHINNVTHAQKLVNGIDLSV